MPEVASERVGHARDPRWRIVLMTVASIGLLGLGLAFAPRVPMLVDRWLDGPYAAHAEQARKREIDERFTQAVMMLHAKRYDHAVAALHRLLELAPQMPEAHVNMGFALLGAGNPRAAHDFFESAMALRPRQANTYYGLAMALEAMQDFAGATGAMKTFLHLSPADAPYVRKAKAALWEWESKRLQGSTGDGEASNER